MPSWRRISARVDGETATNGVRRYSFAVALPSSRRPTWFIGQRKYMSNWLWCTWCTTQTTTVPAGANSGAKNGMPFWKSTTAS